MLRVLNGVFAALFFFAASLQWNDPDPVPWVLIYVAAAAVCLLAVMKRLAWTFAAVVALIALVWAVVLAVQSPLSAAELRHVFDAFKMTKGDAATEEAREAIGLGVVAVWCGLQALGSGLSMRRRRARGRELAAKL